MLCSSMKKIDGRKLPKHKLLEFRAYAFQQMDTGVSNKEIAQEIGVHEVTVATCKKIGLKTSPKGRKNGEKKSLSKRQEQQIQNKLFDMSKGDIAAPFWTKNLIIEMIKKELKQDIPSSTLGDYLKIGT